MNIPAHYLPPGWRTTVCAILLLFGTIHAEQQQAPVTFIPREHIHESAQPLYDAIVTHVGAADSAKRKQFVKTVGPHAQEAVRLLKDISAALEKNNTWQTYEAYRHMHDLYTMDWADTAGKESFLTTIRDRLHQLTDTLPTAAPPGPLATALQKFATAALSLFIEPSHIGGRSLTASRIGLGIVIVLIAAAGIYHLKNKAIDAMNSSLVRNQLDWLRKQPLADVCYRAKEILERGTTDTLAVFSRENGDLLPGIQKLGSESRFAYLPHIRACIPPDPGCDPAYIVRYEERILLLEKAWQSNLRYEMSKLKPGTPAYEKAQRELASRERMVKEAPLCGRFYRHPFWLSVPEEGPSGTITRADLERHGRKAIRAKWQQQLDRRDRSRRELAPGGGDENWAIGSYNGKLGRLGLTGMTQDELTRLTQFMYHEEIYGEGQPIYLPIIAAEAAEGKPDDEVAWDPAELKRSIHEVVAKELQERMNEWWVEKSSGKSRPVESVELKIKQPVHRSENNYLRKMETWHRLDDAGHWRNIGRYLWHRLRGCSHHDALARLATKYMNNIAASKAAFLMTQGKAPTEDDPGMGLLSKRYPGKLFDSVATLRRWLDTAEERHKEGLDTTTHEDHAAHHPIIDNPSIGNTKPTSPDNEREPYALHDDTAWRHRVTDVKRGGPLAIKERALIHEMRKIYNRMEAEIALRKSRGWIGYGSHIGQLYHALLPNKERRQAETPQGWKNLVTAVRRDDLEKDKNYLWECSGIGSLRLLKQELANVRKMMADAGKQTLSLTAAIEGLPPVPTHHGYLLLPEPDDSGIRQLESDVPRGEKFPNNIHDALRGLDWPGTPEAPVAWPTNTNRDPKLTSYNYFYGWCDGHPEYDPATRDIGVNTFGEPVGYESTQPDDEEPRPAGAPPAAPEDSAGDTESTEASDDDA